ncbi:MAG: MMPL family transporter [Clostridiales bacterium]|nr:MMPL family transporter [Clostridiales bacterium]
MKKFYRVIVYNPKKIILLFILFSVIGAFLQSLVSVDYDLKDYLPEESASTVSLEVMQEEFDSGIPNARVMVRDVTIAEALDYKEQLLNCEGVTAVTWLDDAIDILEPVEMADTDTVETYYKDNTALFTLTIDREQRVEAVDAIRELIGEENAMDGDAVSSAISTTGTISEIRKIVIFAVLFVLAVLLLTTTSWAEPFLVLIGLGAAVLINMGSNLIFGEISFVTHAAGAILQLAVSLDYSVFLLHRFEECRRTAAGRKSAADEKGRMASERKVMPDEQGRMANERAGMVDEKEAMVEALCKSASSILSSGLTTVIGFLALVFMSYRIGMDLGLVLAKGVAISLVTVFVFVPALTVTAYKWIDKTRHRSLMPDFRRFGRVITRVMLPMVCVFAVLIVPGFLASNQSDFYYGSVYIYGEDTQFGQDTAVIQSVFGEKDTYVAMVPEGDTATEQALSDTLRELPQVKSILSYVDTVGAEIPYAYLDDSTLSMLVSENYSRFVITVDADSEGEETFALVENIRGILDTYYPEENYLAGVGISAYDLMDSITSDMLKVNLIAIIAVFLVLILTMQSVFLPVILVLGIESAIWINLGIPYFSGSSVFYIAYLIVSSIQLGATVDYAILFANRYMEYRRHMEKRQAVVQTVSSVTVSVLTSGSVLAVVGILMGFVSSNGVLAQLGRFLGIGSLLSMAVVLFVLPGLLCLFDGLIRRTTRHADFYMHRGV